jgi:hypothetical protein
MSATGAIRPTGAVDERSDDRLNGRAHTARRLVTETKASDPKRGPARPARILLLGSGSATRLASVSLTAE